MDSISTIAQPLASQSEHAVHQSKHDFAEAVANAGAKERAVGNDRSSSPENGSDEHSRSPEKIADAKTEKDAKTPGVEELVGVAQSVLVRPVGHIENIDDARIYGVHLLAGRYLSELGSDDASFKSTSDAAFGAEVQGFVRMESASAPSVQAPFGSYAEEDVLPELSLVPALSKGEGKAGEDLSRALQCNEVLAAMPSSQEWLERSLRFAKDRNGEAIAWVRDFRMSDQQIPMLVSDLLNQAKANGIALMRIMLNGHAIWNSTKEV